MKFSSILVIVGTLAMSACALPFTEGPARGSLRASRQRERFGGGGGKSGGGFHGGNGGGNNGGKEASTTSAAAQSTTGAAAGKNGKGGKNKGAGAASSTTDAAAAAASTTSTDTTAAATAAANTTTTAAAAATSAVVASTANSPDLQTSLTLDTALIGANIGQNGLAGGEPGQVASLTSTNNFINFCAIGNLPITNGLQVTTGSCNPIPMGNIPAKTAMPSAKFQNPTNGATIPANQNFTISLQVANMDTGNFVNANTNYFGAPQQLNAQGIIVAHSHVVVEALSSVDSTTVSDPTVFAFFKGLNAPAVNGILTATVTGGLPAGAYKVSSINTAANHQPVLGPVAQHGSFDDVVYFTAA